MDNLQKQIRKIGDRMTKGDISPDDGRKLLKDLRDTAGIPPKQFKSRLRDEMNRLRLGVELNQKVVDRLARAKDNLEALGIIEDQVANGSLPPSAKLRHFRDGFPDVWNTVALRTYKHTDNFGNYQLAYMEWGWALLLQQWKEELSSPITTPHQDTLDTFELHKAHNFPFFFVSKGICDAVWQSDLKFAVDWKSMHLPFEAFTFVLPKVNPLGHEAIIIYRRVKDGDIKLTFVALGKKAVGEEIVVDFPFESKGSESDTERWVFNTIYAMAARPEYVEGGERVGRRKGAESEIWTPNIVGRKYAVKSHTFSKDRIGSVRLHWRRGHFRQQAFGIGRLQHKTIWIEPMMVGGSK